KSDHVKIAQRRLRFQRKQRRARSLVFAHLVELRGSSPTVREGLIITRAGALKLRVRSPRVSKGSLTRGALPDGRASDTIAAFAANTIGKESALARDFRNVVKDFIHRLKAEVRHADRVNVRIAKRD